jgi:hypothetical protein
MATENAAPAATQTIEVARPQALGTEIDPLAIIERRNQMLERLLDYAIKATHAGQWTDQQGKPFPTAAAAEVMARRCAVRISNVRKQKMESQDDLGPFYMYLVEATASLPGEWDSLEAMGTCSSRDQFIGTNGTKHQLSDIDEGNILKAAYSNLIVNAVTRLLGVRNLTWEALGKLGISQDGAAKVEYQHGSQGGGQSRSSSDVDLKFGKCKGQKLSEVSDSDVRFYVGVWEKDLADPEKSKFHGSCKRNLEIAQALFAARANAASGTTAAPAAAGGAALWQRIRALDKEIPDGELRELVKTTTKKANAKDLVEADVALMAEALKKRAADRNEDIPF